MDDMEQVLTALAVFDGTSRRVRRRVAEVATRFVVDAGTELVSAGQPSLELFVVVEGDADVVREGRVVDTVHRGDFFGEIGAIEPGLPRNATVRAATPMVVLAIAAPEVRRLLDDAPDLALRLKEAAWRRRRPVSPAG